MRQEYKKLMFNTIAGPNVESITIWKFHWVIKFIFIAFKYTVKFGSSDFAIGDFFLTAHEFYVNEIKFR